MQDKTGPSIAAEFDLLLPGLRDEHGTGVGLIGVVSQQWRWATLHFDAGAAVTRDQHAEHVLDTTIEGPHGWPVRPASEFFYDIGVGEFQTYSGLIGAVWQVKDNVAVDFAVRGARVDTQTAGEIRAGVTFALGLMQAHPSVSMPSAIAPPGVRQIGALRTPVPVPE